MDYLSEEDFKVAASNGISRQRTYQRFYENGWSRERAITEKVNEGLLKKWKPIYEANDISQPTFYKRMASGMTAEEAATTPKKKRGRSVTKITEEQYKIAEANGLSRVNVRGRVYSNKWEVERAITQPLNEQFKRKAN